MRETTTACAVLIATHGLFYWMGNNLPYDAKTHKAIKMKELGEATKKAAPFVITATPVVSFVSLFFGLGPWRLPLIGLAGLTHAAALKVGQIVSSERNCSNKSEDSGENEKSTFRLT